MKCNHNPTFNHQRGAALLAFVLVMLVGSSFLLISKLNAKVRDREDLVQTYDSLQRTKDAVIAFALTIPERSGANPRPGPGHLPCPDINNDGAGDAAGCNGANFGPNVRIGRIPYQTLEDEVLTGGNGDVLWYAIDVNYGFFAGALPNINSETAGQLSLDNSGDVVALIIDPGPALNGQFRDLINAGNPINNNPVNYLENENGDNDANFISMLIGGNNANFNDNVIAITRQELMATIEKRVLAEVANAFEIYRVDPDFDDVGGVDPTCPIPNPTCDDAFPWLLPFTDPRVNPGTDWFAGVAGTNQGLMGVHIPGQTYGNNNVFTLDWSGLPVPGVAPVTTGASPPIVDCLRNASCTNQYGDVRNTATPLNTVQCNWIDLYSFDCTGVDDFTTAGITRTIRIVYRDDGTGNLTVNPPAIGTIRSRSLQINGNLGANINVNGNPTGSLRIIISDTGANIGSIDHTYPANTVIGFLNINGVDYHLDSVGIDLDFPQDGNYFNPGEISPEIQPWIVNNNWHHQIHITYPVVEPLPGGNVTCTPGLDCLSLSTNGLAAVTNIRGLAMMAGQIATVPGPPQDRATAPANINDYFDTVENTNGDAVFDRIPLSIQNTDQFRIINP